MRQPSRTKSPPRRVAVVTGAGSGIGLAVAERLAADGYAIGLFDRDCPAMGRACASLKTTTAAFCGSVAEEAEARHAMDTLVRELGRIDVLVNSAGISCNMPTLDLSLEKWNQAIAVNLTGTFLCSREAARHMIPLGGGVIVNIGSMYGIVAGPQRAGYCATKSAVDMLGRVLAVEWADHGIRVNTVAPGYVRTRLVETLVAEGKLDEDALRRRTPLHRLADPAEVAELVAFIASDRSSYITGQTMTIDGGWTANGYL
jgi:NAD(P)-dependent dehydrogenase (short-subunit alcohol dehydrogenase family)